MNDEQQLQALTRTYFESMFESSAEKVYAAFHPNAWITGYLPDGLQQLTVSDFAGMVSSQQPSPAQSGGSDRLEIISINIAGDTAVVRVRDDYLGLTFLDTLSCLRVDGTWRIYNKLFHVEGAVSDR